MGNSLKQINKNKQQKPRHMEIMGQDDARDQNMPEYMYFSNAKEMTKLKTFDLLVIFLILF